MRKNIIRIISLLIILLVIVALAYYTYINLDIIKKPINQILNLVGSDSAKVVSIIDGDSLYVLEDDQLTEVRIIGFDAPELEINGKPRECFAQRSIDQLKTYFKESREVNLITDNEVGDTDKYGRKLRYVLNSKDIDIGQDMILKGFGHEMTVQSYKRQDEYIESEKKAKSSSSGIWGKGGCA